VYCTVTAPSAYANLFTEPNDLPSGVQSSLLSARFSQLLLAGKWKRLLRAWVPQLLPASTGRGMLWDKLPCLLSAGAWG